MFLSSLIDAGKSRSAITSALYGINGLVDPTENSVVKNILECGKRLNSKPIQKKDVVSSEQLIKLCRMYTDNTVVLVLICIVLNPELSGIQFTVARASPGILRVSQ